MKSLWKYFPLLFLVFCFDSYASARSDEIKIENIRVKVDGSAVYIDYDLLGPKDKEYEVGITLKRKGDLEFIYIPQKINLSGDVGTGKFAGAGKNIIWYYDKEMKKPAEKDFYIEVKVKLLSSGISPYVWIGGGAAILGGTAAFLLTKKKDGGAPVEKFLPDSPDRP